MRMLEIKKKIVSEYYKLVKSLNIGKQYDYNHILDMINFIDVEENTNNPELIKNYFINR